MTPEEVRDYARERWSAIKESRMEDYLLINGPYIPVRIAAERLGVTKRTVIRYRSELRKRGLHP